MNSKIRGNIGEVAVAQDLLRRGYPVFTELGDSCKVDIITLVDDRAIKIQVKCNSENDGGSCHLSLFKSGPGYGYIYKPSDCDVFALYSLERNIISYIGWHQLNGQDRITVRYEPTKNGQIRGTRMYTEFENFLEAIQIPSSSVVDASDC